MQKIVFANNKGGVGKTASTLSVAGILADMGKRVLIFGMDPQSNLTMGLKAFGIAPVNYMGDLLEGKRTLDESIVALTDNLHHIPTSMELFDTAWNLERNSLRKYEMLRIKLNGISGYDFVLIDTQPDTQTVLSFNAFAYADYVIIPTVAEEYSSAGVPQVMRVLAEVREQCLNPHLDILGFLITFAEKTKICRESEELLREKYMDKVFATKIRRTVGLQSSAKKGLPISEKNQMGYWDYMAFTEEMLKKLGLTLSMAKTAFQSVIIH